MPQGEQVVVQRKALNPSEVDSLFAGTFGPTGGEGSPDSADPPKKWVRRAERCDRCGMTYVYTTPFITHQGGRLVRLEVCPWCWELMQEDPNATSKSKLLVELEKRIDHRTKEAEDTAARTL